MTEQPAMGALQRVVDVSGLRAAPLTVSVKVSDGEREALARELGIEAITALSAQGEIRRAAGGIVHLSLLVEAEVVQLCGVSLEPVPERVEEQVELDFAPPDASGDNRQREVFVDPDEIEPPDPLIDGKIDLGAVVSEHVALGLNPYPRKEGVEIPAEFVVGDDDEDGEDGQVEDGRRGPFAVLANLKARD
ncbi:YceD family protein [Oceanibacterium hippocampi]|uniref:DUF177 domain-containing protein n=1 Tax=Oceanibacterium hippocampi TaxID=745714 RepID=A0A1Y5SNY5_9PROT|nr:DUF177 domain-containing protein [Oceanibacterium hippocampi]SLN45086.1 hypothetical protein OCH7691_01924 [Oceanibacterium hippocampi]